MSAEDDLEVCGCEECTSCLGRQVTSLEKALQVMSDVLAASEQAHVEVEAILYTSRHDTHHAGGQACRACDAMLIARKAGRVIR